MVPDMPQSRPAIPRQSTTETISTWLLGHSSTLFLAYRAALMMRQTALIVSSPAGGKMRGGSAFLTTLGAGTSPSGLEPASAAPERTFIHPAGQAPPGRLGYSRSGFGTCSVGVGPGFSGATTSASSAGRSPPVMGSVSPESASLGSPLGSFSASSTESASSFPSRARGSCGAAASSQVLGCSFPSCPLQLGT